jgi:hypothetical protein
MIRAVSRCCIGLWFALVVAACAHDDARAVSSPSPTIAATSAATATATIAAPVKATPIAAPSVDDKRVTYRKGGVEASMGVGTEADLAAIGLPVYPTIRVQDTFVVKHVEKHKSAFTLQGSVKDDLPTVSAWYAQRLGPSFTSSRMAVLGGIASFARKTATSVESVFLQKQQDASTGIPLTTITLTVTKRR